MSAAVIVGIIIALLVLLTSYAFIFQSIEKKRKQRQRLIAALRLRCANFKHMLHGFPQDFLTKDLVVLACRCLIDSTEQLAKLDPRDENHVEDLKTYRVQLTEAQARETSAKRIQLENLAQIKEIRSQLQDLDGFVEKLMQKGTVAPAHAAVYRRQIHKLILQITIDAYLLQAKQAQQNNKTRLQVHFYTLARKLLARENADRSYSKQIAHLDALIKQGEAKLMEESQVTATPSAVAPAAAKEWDKYEDEELGWKKKTLYD